VPPVGGVAHEITDADVTLPGWLPADHSSFNGMAPAGAMFGYNLVAHPSLDKAWPPLPAEASLLEMAKPDDLAQMHGAVRITSEFVQMDKHGIWWMTACNDEVPWPTATDTSPVSSSASMSSASASEGSAGEICPVPTQMQLILSFVKMTFATDKTVVTSLQPAEGEPLAYVNCDGLPANTGELFSKLVIELLKDENEFYGGEVIKEIVDSSLKFGFGWVTEGLIAGNDEIALTSTRSRGLDPTKVISATNPAVHQGIVTIQAILDPTDRELNPQISLLSDALEREHRGVSFIGLPEGRDSGIRMRYNVPPAGLPMSPKLKIRAVIWGLLDGPFSEVTMSYYRIIQPTTNTPTPIVAGDTTLVFDVVTPSDDSDGAGLDLPAENAIQVESAEFTIAPGDTIFVEMLRAAAATPVFAGDVGIIRVGGIIVPG